jgi:hypothetical protein
MSDPSPLPPPQQTPQSWWKEFLERNKTTLDWAFKAFMVGLVTWFGVVLKTNTDENKVTGLENQLNTSRLVADRTGKAEDKQVVQAVEAKLEAVKGSASPAPEPTTK